ncbi:hypothetical protein DK853_38970, partial [Klebsiella oxytoca]
MLAPSDPEFISLVRKLLDLMNISYVIACGEGEAQCVWLQVSGAVDFILKEGFITPSNTSKNSTFKLS